MLPATSAKSGGVVMPFLQNLDERFAEWHGGALPLISKEKADEAAGFWGNKAKETGNPLYRIPQGMASLVAEHPDEVLMILSVGKASPKSGVPEKSFVLGDNVAGPYVRPVGAGPTAAQKASVQGKPWVDCGVLSKNQVADHIDPLVAQHYRTGSVNIQQQSSLGAVQPHCPR